MKELSTEEKAKLYEEAIDRAKKWYNAPNIDKMPTYGNRIIEEIFPELNESNDERIKKDIIEYFENCNIKHLDWIDWLKRQSKQNSAWSGKDEETLLKMMFAFKVRVFPSSEECDSFIDFLKSLKNKVQPKQERGDEDECYMSGFLNLTDD